MTDQTTETDMTGVSITSGGQSQTYTADTSAEAEEAELIAGKFKTQDDLVAAYAELEKKLGAGKPETAPETPEEAPTETSPEDTEETTEEEEESPYGKVVTEALSAAELSLDDVRQQYADNEGKLDDSTFDALGKAGFPRAMVESYLRGLETAQENVKDTANAEVASIIESVGGEAEFAKVRNHVASEFSAEERAAYDAEISSGDVERVRNAVAVAKAEYLKAVGHEGKMTGGGKTPTGVDGYNSEAEWLEAMQSPKYKTSEAYRQEVTARMSKSAFFVTR